MSFVINKWMQKKNLTLVWVDLHLSCSCTEVNCQWTLGSWFEMFQITLSVIFCCLELLQMYIFWALILKNPPYPQVSSWVCAVVKGVVQRQDIYIIIIVAILHYNSEKDLLFHQFPGGLQIQDFQSFPCGCGLYQAILPSGLLPEHRALRWNTSVLGVSPPTSLPPKIRTKSALAQSGFV